MGEVLSQNEIDSLLAALSTGELDAEEIQKKLVAPIDYEGVYVELNGFRKESMTFLSDSL